MVQISYALFNQHEKEMGGGGLNIDFSCCGVPPPTFDLKCILLKARKALFKKIIVAECYLSFVYKVSIKCHSWLFVA